MRRKKILSISLDAIFLAIILLMTYTFIGFIPLGFISITIIHVPVLIGAYLFGPKKGALYGLFFGICSFLRSWESPSGLDLFFQNPLVSVFPRILFGLIAGLIFDFIKKMPLKNIIKQPLIIIGCFISTIIHSVLVLGTLGLIYEKEINTLLEGSFASFWIFMLSTIATSSVFEALAGAIITPLISFPLEKYVLKDYLKLLENEKNKTKKNLEPLQAKAIITNNKEIELTLQIKK